MGMSERVSGGFKGLASNMQDGVRTSFFSSLLFTLRMISGTLLGAFLGLVAQELMGFGNLGLTLCLLVVLTVFMRISSGWTYARLFVFDLICVLVAQLLRMYIMLAP